MNLENYLELHPKKILIFDFDGTIAYLDIPWYILSQKLKVIADQAGIKADDSQGNIKYINDLALAGDELFLQKLIKINEEFENEYLRGYKTKFYLWTNNSLKTVQRVLGEIGVYLTFSKFITRDSVRLTKPYPEGFLKVLEQDNLDKSNYLMIGDNPDSDGVAANAAGIEYFRVF
jgi:HAD superfamily hydrolase (TIGR01549 family)